MFLQQLSRAGACFDVVEVVHRADDYAQFRRWNCPFSRPHPGSNQHTKRQKLQPVNYQFFHLSHVRSYLSKVSVGKVVLRSLQPANPALKRDRPQADGPLALR